MTHLLSSAWFQVVGIPLLLMGVGVYAKRLSRRHGDPTPGLNDAAVSTTLLLVALGTVVADLRSGAVPELPTWLGWLLGVLFALLVSIDHDRYQSWVRDADGLPTPQKRPVVGIIVPDIMSLVIFAAYQMHKVQGP